MQRAVLGCISQRNTTNTSVCVCVCVKKFILKNWLITLAEAGKYKICRVGWQAGNPGRRQCYSSSLKAGAAALPLAQGNRLAGVGGALAVVLGLFGPSTDWTRPTHIMKGNLLYSKSTNYNDNLVHKHLHRNIQNNV